jgi:GNAT superfamily N-acetyltransferase
VACTELDGLDADAAIGAQIGRFARSGGRWEWKHHSYDLPADLPQRLTSAGFAAGPVEALLVAEIAELVLEASLPDGVELAVVRDERGARALVALQDEAFAGDSPGMAESLIAGLAQRPSTLAAVMAIADGAAVAGGRVEFNPGTDFAGLWGGCTHPAWRSRGLFRALVAYRARLASERGFRYLQVDASAQSLPILQRLGFVKLAETTPFTYTSRR